MGLIILIPSMIYLICAIACFGRQKYRKLYKLDEIKNMFNENGLSVSYQCAKDGSHLLIKDLILTTQRALSLIMAAHIGLSEQYQLLLYDTVQMIYGSKSAFVMILAVSMRLFGSTFLGEKNYVNFKWMVKSLFICANLLGFISFLLMVTFRTSIAYNYVSDKICQYQQYECSMG
eukprot:274909_1